MRLRLDAVSIVAGDGSAGLIGPIAGDVGVQAASAVQRVKIRAAFNMNDGWLEKRRGLYGVCVGSAIVYPSYR